MFGSRILIYLINLVFGFIELLLVIRFFLRLFGASTAAPFVRWIIETSNPLISPFRGMFPDSVLSGGFVIEINVLIAILIYALAAYLIEEFLAFLTYSSDHYYRRVSKR